MSLWLCRKYAPRIGYYEAHNGNYLALTIRSGATMENVALNHEKCRFCPSSSEHQERKRIVLKETTRRRREIVVGF
jgi:hypothetical protein